MAPRTHWVTRTHWVVRGGMAAPDLLEKGYAQHKGVPHVFGFSVQYAVGKKVDELARAGQIQNNKISYADLSALQRALAPLGYRAEVIRTPGVGYHHTLVVVYDAAGTMLQRLPRDAAIAMRPSP